MKAVNCGKVKNTMMYTGSPHNPRVLQSPFKHERDFTIVRSLYKPIPRLLLQSSNKTTKNNPLGFFTNLFPTILDKQDFNHQEQSSWIYYLDYENNPLTNQ